MDRKSFTAGEPEIDAIIDIFQRTPFTFVCLRLLCCMLMRVEITTLIERTKDEFMAALRQADWRLYKTKRIPNETLAIYITKDGLCLGLYYLPTGEMKGAVCMESAEIGLNIDASIDWKEIIARCFVGRNFSIFQFDVDTRTVRAFEIAPRVLN